MSAGVGQRRHSSASQAFWMRAVRFAGLHRILHLVGEHRDGIRVKDLNMEILGKGLYRTERGQPAKSTLYHCRNALLHLGAVRRWNQRLVVASDNTKVAVLLHEPMPTGNSLSDIAREAFSSLVLANQDCVEAFFSLFLPKSHLVGPEQFRCLATPVVWLQSMPNEGSRRIEMRAAAGDRSVVLSSPVEIQSILYGVRYWARDELQLIDEFFQTGRGSVMFAVRNRQSRQDQTECVLQRILARPRDPGEWTTISINALLQSICEREGFRVAILFDAIRTMVVRNPSHVALIPTIPNMAAISARSQQREAFELRAYFTDSRGRLISHLRFHNSLEGTTA